MRVSERGILSFLERLVSSDPAFPLLGSGKMWLDARAVLAFVAHIGSYLRRIGLLPGDLVAFRPGRNVPSALMMLGLRSVGATVVLADPRQPLEETLAGAEAPLPVRAQIEHIRHSCFEFTWLDTAERRTQPIELFALPPSGEQRNHQSSADPAFIIFTSGSTGKSKAVVLSEFNLVNNLLDSQPLGDYRAGDRALGCLPLHHVFGLVLLAGAAVLGYGVYFPEKTDPASLLTAIGQEALTRMNGVPSLYLAMAELCDGFDIHTLRAGFIGGGPITAEQFALIEESLGMTLIPVYGMSECVGISCASWQDSRAERAAGVGRFYSINTGRILRPDGTEAAAGEEGEIWVAGPARMIGYYGKPLPREDLFPTGDLGYLDQDGVLHLTGRRKEIIIRNGNNLSLRRIEEALLRLPEVRDAVVVALPDERQGEVPAAMVVADHDRPLVPDLRKHELPVLYHYVERMPLTASGKPDRQRIREVLAQCRVS